ncbi:MAG: winged helix-turn-helix transcriptional regulator [Candidatus Tantalella remota]|nr:winged helix-turn-helix transcriptional regulator [Candidatus Tantalella remota]
MDVRKMIIKELSKKGEVKVSDIIEITGLSRAYINRFLQDLRAEGMILLVGKANKAKYIPATAEAIKTEKKKILNSHRILHNDGKLQEDLIFADIVNNTGIFNNVHKNIIRITEYAFTEMLNNAIEHSGSKKIEILMERHKSNILFTVQDRGIGIFNNIRVQKHLLSEMEAIQDLLKGKLTTAPSLHSGEGIFFTS